MEYVEGSNLREYMHYYAKLSRPPPKIYVMECFMKLTEVSIFLLFFSLFFKLEK
jgi:hypothetical protein